MNYSTNYSMREPVPGEKVKVADINYNTEIIDGVMLDNRQISLEMYRDYETYNKNRVVGHENEQGRIRAYRCLEDGTTGAWDDTKWVQTNISDELEDIRENAGASDLGDLNDVDLTNPTDGQALLYDDTTEKWHNSDLPDADVTKTASGNPIEFSDGADAPLVKCTTAITGSQDLHGYDKPWVGGAGVNMLSPAPIYSNTVNDVTITSDGNGNYTLNGLASATVSVDLTLDTPLSFPNSNVYLHLRNTSASGDVILVLLADDNTQLINRGANNINQVSVATNKYGNTATKIRFYISLGTNVNMTLSPMVLSTATIDKFYPYSNICPITAYTEGKIEVSDGDGNATTHTTTYPSAIYRGSEDVVNGTETHDMEVYSFTGDETITQAPANQYVFNVVAPTKFDLGIYHSQDAPRAWSHFNGVNYKDAVNMANGEARQFNAGGFWYFSFCNHNLASVSDCKTWLQNQAQNGTPVQIAAPLFTPTTESITPTNLPLKSLFGYNHIESSTGEMEIEYFPQKEQPLIDLIPEASNMHEYSTAEHAVGTWVDGKDVYEKTYVFSSLPIVNDWTAFDEDCGIDTLVDYSLMFTRSNGQIDNDSDVLRVAYNPPNALGDLCYYPGGVEATHITVRYTKTSSNNRSLAKSAPQETKEEQVEELKEEPTEEVKEETTEEVKEEPEEEVEEVKEEVKEKETKEEGEINER